MNAVADHYRNLLAEVYSWMFGGFAHGVRTNVGFFDRHGIRPRGSGVAVDLGAGCGFQSIPLALAGFEVLAIDLDQSLLDELERNRNGASVRTLAGDLMNFDAHLDGKAELVVCMTDTLLHLDSAADVERLFTKTRAALEPGGRFIATFRDLSVPLEGLDRFLPVRSDDTRILSCFLEYEPDTVTVHDLLYANSGNGWQLTKSCYRKLRISPEWVCQGLTAAGFEEVQSSVERGLTTVLAWA